MVLQERRQNPDIGFHEDEVKLAKIMMDTLRTTVEFLYYLVDYRNKSSFTMILLSAEGLNLEMLLQKWKRRTDVLFEIDKINNVYVIICQSTDREGGKRYAEILLSNIHMNSGHSTYCVAAELETTGHAIQEVIFKMVEKYMLAKQDNDENQVFFTKLAKEESENLQDITYR
jgi:hypothetical protein